MSTEAIRGDSSEGLYPKEALAYARASMPINELFHERQRRLLQGDAPDVYTYDKLPHLFATKSFSFFGTPPATSTTFGMRRTRSLSGG